MTLTSDSDTKFSELDQLELSGYRPLNRFALGSLLLGCLSPAALIHPVLGVLPLFAALSGIIALRQIRSSEAKQTGRVVAVLGIYLALIFGSWSIVQQSTRSARLYGQARQFSEHWFDLLRENRLFEAHQLTVPESNRAAPGESLEEHYAFRTAEERQKLRAAMTARSEGASGGAEMDITDMMGEDPIDKLKQFFEQPLPKRLKELGRNVRFEFRENVQIVAVGAHSAYVEVMFDAVPQGASAARPIPVVVTLQRMVPSGLIADWQVSGFRDPNAKK